MSRGAHLLCAMLNISRISNKYPTPFLVKVNPPLECGIDHTKARIGSDADVSVRAYQKHKVAIKRIRTKDWDLVGPKRETVPQVAAA